MANRRVLGIVLAGAAGRRLAPLTEDRAKSAVPFGGLYRLVDFALSNLGAGVTVGWTRTGTANAGSRCRRAASP